MSVQQKSQKLSNIHELHTDTYNQCLNRISQSIFIGILIIGSIYIYYKNGATICKIIRPQCATYVFLYYKRQQNYCPLQAGTAGKATNPCTSLLYEQTQSIRPSSLHRYSSDQQIRAASQLPKTSGGSKTVCARAVLLQRGSPRGRSPLK